MNAKDTAKAMGPTSGVPKFRNPPVIETILGVQFEPLSEMTNAHLGVFWKQLDPQWSNVTDAQALEPQFELFGEAADWSPATFKLRFSQETASRLRIRNADNNRMIQVQNGRLHLNWLGHDGDPYPSYEKVRPQFDCEVENLKAFLKDESLGEFRPNQWEVTYINHILKGTVWDDPQDWAGLFKLPGLTTEGLQGVDLESFTGGWQFEIKPRLGRLHVQLQNGRRGGPEGEEMVLMNLTARGPVREQATENRPAQSLDQGLNLGHETIVTAFAALTSQAAHQYWERIDVNG